MFAGFKDFILRGNVVELAVAVVIGAAFTAVVGAITDNLINPVVALFGSPDAGGLVIQLREGVPATTINFSLIIGAVINFLIIAAVVYFIFVMPMNTINARIAARKEELPPPAAEDVMLLQEIRDLLAAQVGPAPNTPPGTPGPTAPAGSDEV